MCNLKGENAVVHGVDSNYHLQFKYLTSQMLLSFTSFLCFCLLISSQFIYVVEGGQVYSDIMYRPKRAEN